MSLLDKKVMYLHHQIHRKTLSMVVVIIMAEITVMVEVAVELMSEPFLVRGIVLLG